MASHNSDGVLSQVTYMWKDDNSHTGDCPAVHTAELNGQPGYVVQGVPIDGAADRGKLSELGPDDGAIWVPANVLDKLRGQ